MNKNEDNVELFSLSVTERLENRYAHSEEYKISLKRERELFTQLQQILNEEQLKIVIEYQTAVSSTTGICEKLAYQQGMRDLISILYSEK